MNKKDEAAVVREALVLFGSEVGDQSLRYDAQAALDSLITQRDQALAEAERLRADALAFAEMATDYIGGPCDDPEKNPHVEVWCISHQEKRCTGTADYERAAAYLRQALPDNTREGG